MKKEAAGSKNDPNPISDMMFRKGDHTWNKSFCLWSRRALSGGSRLGVWWGQSIKWVLKSPYVFNSPSFFVTVVGNHTKVVIFHTPRNWLFLLLELYDLSWKHHSLKPPCIINSQKAWSRSKKIGPIFRKLHITENAVGVPNNLISTISFWKIYIDPVVPQNFVTADRWILPRPGWMLATVFPFNPGHPAWSTWTPGGTFAYIKGYVYCKAATNELSDFKMCPPFLFWKYTYVLF